MKPQSLNDLPLIARLERAEREIARLQETASFLLKRLGHVVPPGDSGLYDDQQRLKKSNFKKGNKFGREGRNSARAKSFAAGALAGT